MTLIIKDTQDKTYAGQVTPYFSTLLEAKLYSQDKNEVQQAIENMIRTHQLKPFDNEHQDALIILNVHGIYLIDAPNKTIITTNVRSDVIMLRALAVVNYLNNRADSTENLVKINNMIKRDELIIDNSMKHLLLEGIDDFFVNPNVRSEATRNFQIAIFETDLLGFNLNQAKNGWSVTQIKPNLDFYEDFFSYLYEQHIFLNDIEKTQVIDYFNCLLLNNDPSVEKDIKSFFIRLDAQVEKIHLQKLTSRKTNKSTKIKI